MNLQFIPPNELWADNVYVIARFPNLTWGDDMASYELVLPHVTIDMIAEAGIDWQDYGKTKQEAVEFVNAFPETFDLDILLPGIFPQMDIFWPVTINSAYTGTEAATMIYRYSPDTTLIYLGEDELPGIALTGGGMDLSWEIAMAYVCCGQLPPHSLLQRMPNYGASYRSEAQQFREKTVLESMLEVVKVLNRDALGIERVHYAFTQEERDSRD